MSCLYEKSYDDLFQCIREYVNSKNSFKGASYFIKTKSETIAIEKDKIFPSIYMPTILNYHSLAFLSKTYRLKLEYPYLPENSQLIVSLKKKNKTVEYIIDIGKRREDIHFNTDLRTKLPESILLTNLEDPEDIKKLIEARPYGFKTKRDIEKLKKSLDKRLVDNFYAPLSLSLILPLKNQEYFPNIYYISKPYTISTPYVFEILLGTWDIIRVPKKLYTYKLNFLSIMGFERSPTMVPHLVDRDPYFELNQKNLNKFEIQIKYDEFQNRFYNFMTETLKVISILKFSPADIGPQQMVMKNGRVIFIDIASGNDIAISQKGLEKIIVKANKDIIEGIENSPLLKHCIKKENYVICNEKIKESELPKMLVADIRRSLIENLNYNRTYNLDNLLKNIKIGDLRLDDIIIQYKDDEFEENREIVSRSIELYLGGHVN
jgi:hypothetical protein